MYFALICQGNNSNRYGGMIGVMIYLHAEIISSVQIAFYREENKGKIREKDTYFEVKHLAKP